jgi:hypothetical protein
VRFWRDAGKCIDRMQRERARIVAILQAALAASKRS